MSANIRQNRQLPLRSIPTETDLKVTLIDGAYHDVDSSALAFEIAARAALRKANVVTAMVSLANMFGYANTLRSTSQRRATFSMQFDHDAPAPVPKASNRFGLR